MLDYDCFGHCCLCHKNMLVEEVIGGKVQMRFLPDYDETEYLLDDGSKMRVALCKPCKSQLSEKHHDKVMGSIIKGWRVEVDNLKHWDKAKKDAYMEIYSQKQIVCKSENVPVDVLDKKFSEHLNKKDKVCR